MKEQCSKDKFLGDERQQWIKYRDDQPDIRGITWETQKPLSVDNVRSKGNCPTKQDKHQQNKYALTPGELTQEFILNAKRVSPQQITDKTK